MDWGFLAVPGVSVFFEGVFATGGYRSSMRKAGEMAQQSGFLFLFFLSGRALIHDCVL